MDFASMFSNIQMGERYASPGSSDTATYHENQLARADAEGRRQAEEASQSRSVFASARAEIDAGVEGPAMVAYMYPSAVSEIKNLVRGGHLDKANERVQFLKQSADDHAATYRTYESSKGSNAFDNAVSSGGHAMAQYSFWDETLTMPDGASSTIGDMFRDGEAYKTARQDSLLTSNMSEGFVDSYKNADPFKKRMFSMVADPVAKGLAGANVPYYSDVGNYLDREWDSLVTELGQNGVQRLVQDVVAKRIGTGTAIDVLEGVRDFVYAQTNGDGAGRDGDVLVRQYLGTYDRLDSVAPKISGKETSPQTKMVISKLLSAVAEGQRVGSNNINFDDPDTLRRTKEVLDVFATAEDRGIYLLEEGTEGGANMRAALSDYVTGNTESNFVRRINGMFDLTDSLITTSGQPTSLVSNLRTGLRNELSSASVRLMSSGSREDLAVQSVLGDESMRTNLADRWASSLVSNGGFSPQTAQYLTSKMLGSMMSNNGVRAVDLNEALVTSSFDRDCPDQVKTELRRWYKGNNMISDLMDRKYKADFMALKMNRVIGDSMNDKQALGAYAKLCSDMVPYIAAGHDPDVAMDRVLNSAPIYRPTGAMVLPGGITIPEADLQKMYNEVRKSQGETTYQVNGENYRVTKDMLEAAIPEIEFSGVPEYLPEVSLAPVRSLGMANGLEAGAWRSSTGRTAFLRIQEMYKQAYEAARLSRIKHSDAADKRVAKEDPSEPSS